MIETCPVCQTAVAVQADGSRFPHKRYADGAGPGLNQSHDLVPCEGGSDFVFEKEYQR